MRTLNIHTDHNPAIEQAMREKCQELYEQSGVKYTIDHIWPVAKGGVHHHDNLQLLPAVVNSQKSDSLKFTNPLYKTIYDIPQWLFDECMGNFMTIPVEETFVTPEIKKKVGLQKLKHIEEIMDSLRNQLIQMHSADLQNIHLAPPTYSVTLDCNSDEQVEEDLIPKFINSNFDFSNPKAQIGVNCVYPVYLSWCDEKGLNPEYTNAELKKLLIKTGWRKREVTKGTVWYGVKLKSKDIIGQFLEECTEQDQDSLIQLGCLYATYTTWANQNGVKFPLTKQKLNNKIEERKAAKKVRKEKGWFFQGLRLV